MLLDRGRRCPALQCFDIRRDRDGLNVFEVLIPGALSPVQELLDCPVVGGACIRVLALRIGTVKNSKNRVVASGPRFANDRRNLE